MLWIGSDHGGFEMKQEIIAYLKEHQVSFEDIGSFSTEIVRYPYYASKVAAAVSEGKIERGILICSSGIGMSVIANRYPKVRASLCTSALMGKMTRAHNDSNILCLGGKITGIWEALAILENWLNTPYEGGRHDISLGIIAEAEKTISNGESFAPVIPKEGEQ